MHMQPVGGVVLTFRRTNGNPKGIPKGNPKGNPKENPKENPKGNPRTKVHTKFLNAVSTIRLHIAVLQLHFQIPNMPLPPSLLPNHILPGGWI